MSVVDIQKISAFSRILLFQHANLLGHHFQRHATSKHQQYLAEYVDVAANVAVVLLVLPVNFDFRPVSVIFFNGMSFAGF